MKNFITFEGCEGVGKSKQQTLLRSYLEKEKVNFIFTREPGGSVISEKIRAIILDGKNTDMSAECEALLYASARVQHLHDTVKPALDKGKLVICDRYIDSSFAYQAEARGLGYEFVEKINAYAIENYMPTLTIFLDLPPSLAFKRKGGADKEDRLENAGMEFHEKVYLSYVKLAKKFPTRIERIDASGDKEHTHNEIIKVLKDRKIIG